MTNTSILRLRSAELPQGKLPILEVDGKIIPQSGAMIRHVARVFDLYGGSNLEKTLVDVVIETIEDFSTHTIKMFFEKDDDTKAQLLTKLLTETVPLYLTIFEKILDKNDWMVGSKMTIADLAVYNTFEFIAEVAKKENGTDIFDKKSTLKEHFNRVRSIPGIKEWLEKRPQTDH
ncbi:Glutathione S-transferase [Mizuhopecten yessoensis]|uniref:Glutathione S-transferase n=1 Tax=Mizuhopecten yessoensis TaxID=6573 RepID=A0A210PPR6_MIZYE|nr:Glutathione S-transferase [Mizuhopecten yessoensis]